MLSLWWVFVTCSIVDGLQNFLLESALSAALHAVHPSLTMEQLADVSPSFHGTHFAPSPFHLETLHSHYCIRSQSRQLIRYTPHFLIRVANVMMHC